MRFQDFFVQAHDGGFSSWSIGFGALTRRTCSPSSTRPGLLGETLDLGVPGRSIGPAPTLLCAMRIENLCAGDSFRDPSTAVMMFALLYGFTFLMTGRCGDPRGTSLGGRLVAVRKDDRTRSRWHRGVGTARMAFVWGSYDRAFLLMLTTVSSRRPATPLVLDPWTGVPTTKGSARYRMPLISGVPRVWKH